ncbi:MAG: uncharacterized protein A8A55_0185 [Amphiamblys sp. WSBS2006]|nr:MAG: uncharacterized protein A8A55_0185 [Amphiamblys sp. WSBS2006]
MYFGVAILIGRFQAGGMCDKKDREKTEHGDADGERAGEFKENLADAENKGDLETKDREGVGDENTPVADNGNADTRNTENIPGEVTESECSKTTEKKEEPAKSPLKKYRKNTVRLSILTPVVFVLTLLSNLCLLLYHLQGNQMKYVEISNMKLMTQEGERTNFSFSVVFKKSYLGLSALSTRSLSVKLRDEGSDGIGIEACFDDLQLKGSPMSGVARGKVRVDSATPVKKAEDITLCRETSIYIAAKGRVDVVLLGFIPFGKSFDTKTEKSFLELFGSQEKSKESSYELRNMKRDIAHGERSLDVFIDHRKVDIQMLPYIEFPRTELTFFVVTPKKERSFMRVSVGDASGFSMFHRKASRTRVRVNVKLFKREIDDSEDREEERVSLGLKAESNGWNIVNRFFDRKYIFFEPSFFELFKGGGGIKGRYKADISSVLFGETDSKTSVKGSVEADTERMSLADIVADFLFETTILVTAASWDKREYKMSTSFRREKATRVAFQSSVFGLDDLVTAWCKDHKTGNEKLSIDVLFSSPHLVFSLFSLRGSQEHAAFYIHGRAFKSLSVSGVAEQREGPKMKLGSIGLIEKDRVFFHLKKTSKVQYEKEKHAVHVNFSECSGLVLLEGESVAGKIPFLFSGSVFFEKFSVEEIKENGSLFFLSEICERTFEMLVKNEMEEVKLKKNSIERYELIGTSTKSFGHGEGVEGGIRVTAMEDLENIELEAELKGTFDFKKDLLSGCIFEGQLFVGKDVELVFGYRENKNTQWGLSLKPKPTMSNIDIFVSDGKATVSVPKTGIPLRWSLVREPGENLGFFSEHRIAQCIISVLSKKGKTEVQQAVAEVQPRVSVLGTASGKTEHEYKLSFNESSPKEQKKRIRLGLSGRSVLRAQKKTGAEFSVSAKDVKTEKGFVFLGTTFHLSLKDVLVSGVFCTDKGRCSAMREIKIDVEVGVEDGANKIESVIGEIQGEIQKLFGGDEPAPKEDAAKTGEFPLFTVSFNGERTIRIPMIMPRHRLEADDDHPEKKPDVFSVFLYGEEMDAEMKKILGKANSILWGGMEIEDRLTLAYEVGSGVSFTCSMREIKMVQVRIPKQHGAIKLGETDFRGKSLLECRVTVLEGFEYLENVLGSFEIPTSFVPSTSLAEAATNDDELVHDKRNLSVGVLGDTKSLLSRAIAGYMNAKLNNKEKKKEIKTSKKNMYLRSIEESEEEGEKSNFANMEYTGERPAILPLHYLKKGEQFKIDIKVGEVSYVVLDLQVNPQNTNKFSVFIRFGFKKKEERVVFQRLVNSVLLRFLPEKKLVLDVRIGGVSFDSVFQLKKIDNNFKKKLRGSGVGVICEKIMNPSVVISIIDIFFPNSIDYDYFFHDVTIVGLLYDKDEFFDFTNNTGCHIEGVPRVVLVPNVPLVKVRYRLVDDEDKKNLNEEEKAAAEKENEERRKMTLGVDWRNLLKLVKGYKGRLNPKGKQLLNITSSSLLRGYIEKEEGGKRMSLPLEINMGGEFLADGAEDDKKELEKDAPTGDIGEGDTNRLTMTTKRDTALLVNEPEIPLNSFAEDAEILLSESFFIPCGTIGSKNTTVSISFFAGREQTLTETVKYSDLRSTDRSRCNEKCNENCKGECKGVRKGECKGKCKEKCTGACSREYNIFLMNNPMKETLFVFSVNSEQMIKTKCWSYIDAVNQKREAKSIKIKIEGNKSYDQKKGGYILPSPSKTTIFPVKRKENEEEEESLNVHVIAFLNEIDKPVYMELKEGELIVDGKEKLKGEEEVIVDGKEELKGELIVDGKEKLKEGALIVEDRKIKITLERRKKNKNYHQYILGFVNVKESGWYRVRLGEKGILFKRRVYLKKNSE